MVKACVTPFKKLDEAVSDALEQGRKEGLSDKAIGELIRQEMLAAGLHRNTVARALPASAKGKPRGSVSTNLVQNETEFEQDEEEDQDPVIYQMSEEQYDIKDIEKYDKAYLIKLVIWFEKKEMASYERSLERDNKLRDVMLENEALRKEIKRLGGKTRPDV
jgi:hypothetical protein